MSLAERWGVKPPAPLTPRPMRMAMKGLLMGGVDAEETALAIRKRYRAGEWNRETEFGFDHLALWGKADWMEFVERFSKRPDARDAPKRRYQTRKAREAAEAEEARKQAELDELADEDAKKRLDRLRREILSRLTIPQQAELLVGQAMGDHAQTARSATAQIIEILGLKAANVPEAPGAGPIFVLPEGAGPKIR